jgi:fermentation-respiration switch protein FrsA (DUF1100 family)
MPVHLFAKFNYKTIDSVRRIHCPVLFIHSRNDKIIPFELGLRLYEAASEPKKFVEIVGSHNDGFMFSGDIYTQGWQEWLELITTHKDASKSRLKRIS